MSKAPANMSEERDIHLDIKIPVEDEDVPDTEAYAMKRGWVREAADRSMRLTVTVFGFVALMGCLR